LILPELLQTNSYKLLLKFHKVFAKVVLKINNLAMDFSQREQEEAQEQMESVSALLDGWPREALIFRKCCHNLAAKSLSKALQIALSLHDLSSM
jgi:hypothetical protein